MKVILDLDFIKNYNELPKAIQLLFLLFDLTAKKGNKIDRDKKYFAEYIDVQKQTAGAYLQQFVDSNILKYRYGGPTFVNPNFCYVVDDAQLADVRKEYSIFKSTM